MDAQYGMSRRQIYIKIAEYAFCMNMLISRINKNTAPIDNILIQDLLVMVDSWHINDIPKFIHRGGFSFFFFFLNGPFYWNYQTN